MPRALTEQEKYRNYRKLLEKGKDIIMVQGVRKTSVDDVTKAAGISKGSFYQHFESKEKFFCQLVMDAHRQIFSQAERMIKSGDNQRVNAHSVLKNLFHMPEMAFFIQNEHEITELILNTIPSPELQSFKQMEEGLFEGLLKLAGVDTDIVKPGVVHNYIHTLFFAMGSDLMVKEDLPETCDQMMNSLIEYIFMGLST